MQFGQLIARHAKYAPDRIAVVQGQHRLTFAEFNHRVDRLAGALIGAGVQKGDKVACVLGNCIEILDLYWATAKIGAVAVPLSPLLSAKGLASLISHSQSVLVIVDSSKCDEFEKLSEYLPQLSSSRFIMVGGARDGARSYDDFVSEKHGEFVPAAEVSGNDPLMMIYSSGTTGDPKGIVLSYQVRMMYCALYASAWRMTPESITLHAGSLVFNGSFMTLLPSFFLGGRYILHSEFNVDHFIETIEREQVTHITLVPSQIIALLEHKRFTSSKLKSLEAIISLGATLHLRHKLQLEENFPGCFYEMYGLAEGFMTILDRGAAPEKLGSVGTPPPFFEMRIVDPDGAPLPPGQVGEIVGRGPIMMSGYFGRDDLTANAVKDGWLYSGDLGYVDEDGYLFLADRKKDLIKSGGIGVYPRDIEEVAVQHPAVSDAAVFGVPHEKWGETPVVAVILSGRGNESEDLKNWINANVTAKFQRVSDVVVLEQFPRNAAGKTLKRSIREMYLSGKIASSAGTKQKAG